MPVTIPGSAFEVDDLALAAALLSMGVAFEADCPFRVYEPQRGPRRWVFCFRAVSECGKFRTGELVKVWDDEAWMKSHRNHPWAVLRAGMANLAEVEAMARRAVPLAEVAQGGVKGFLSLNASDDLQAKVFRRLREKARRRR